MKKKKETTWDMFLGMIVDIGLITTLAVMNIVHWLVKSKGWMWVVLALIFQWWIVPMILVYWFFKEATK